MELWDEEVGADVHGVGIFTLPEMELPFGEMAPLMDEIRRVASEILARDKFLVTLGGEHSITPPLVAAAAARYPGLSVLQIDAHADLRDCYMGTRAQPRLRDAPEPRARADDAGRHPQHVDRGSRGRRRAERRRSSTTSRCGATRPGSIGSSSRWATPSTSPSTWTGWTRRSCRRPARRSPAGCRGTKSSPCCAPPSPDGRVVACDVVELSPIPGIMAPNFLCAKLIYKILTYRFAGSPASQTLELR